MKNNHIPAMASVPSAAPARLDRVIVSALVLAFITALGGFWWMCARNETIAFLPRRAGAEWIVFPKQAAGTQHEAIPVAVAFQHSFTLTNHPATATLAVCA